ncbi:MAG TPA: sigma-70 family RNA polymerase sigma factor [Solirubrobacteraceae bacterium]|nr:sigma-70 family RNA polymerase sigma factor [Solirubrobacteraceae bacterium]
MSDDRSSVAIPTLGRRERPILAATMISSLVLRTQPDARLTALAAEGSEAAFEAIVQRYRRDLLAYCSRLLLSDGRAEDAVQQALMCAWTALRGGAEVEHLKPWLYRITHNQAISTLRRPGWDFAELSESLSGRDAPDADLERRMLMRETLAAVAALPREQRQAILRTAVEGDSYAAVASSMGVSDAAVRGLVQRARVNLRAAVAAIAPTPLVLWAAGIERRHSGAVAWLSTALSNGGGAGASIGAGAVVIKSAAVLASSAALVGGSLAEHHRTEAHRAQPRVTSRDHAAERSAPAERSAAVPRGNAPGRASVGNSTPQITSPVTHAAMPVARRTVRAIGRPQQSGSMAPTGMRAPAQTESRRTSLTRAPARANPPAPQRSEQTGSEPPASTAGAPDGAAPDEAAPDGAAPAATAGAGGVASTSTGMSGSTGDDASTTINPGFSSPSASQ